MICHQVEVGRAFVDQELADAMQEVYAKIQQTGSFPWSPNEEPPLTVKTLKELGVISRCRMTKISYRMTEYGKCFPDCRELCITDRES